MLGPEPHLERAGTSTVIISGISVSRFVQRLKWTVAAALMLQLVGVLHAQGGSASSLQQLESACQSGDTASCTRTGLIYSDPADERYDPFFSLRYLQDGCSANDFIACGRLSLIYLEGTEDIDADHARSGKFAFQACAGQDRIGCEVAEAIFADASSPQFDAEKALRYRRVNCDYGKIASCAALARIYYNIEDFVPAEQIAARACTSDSRNSDICSFANALKQRRLKIEQAMAEQRRQQVAARDQKTAVVRSFLSQGNYDSAIYAAIYNSRTTADAQLALEATLRAGALGSLYKDHLYVLDYWFPTGTLNRAVNAEIAKRAHGDDCGIYNCTNMPGASARRWNAQNGAAGSASRYRSSGSSSAQPRVKSAAEIARDTRSKYRSAHCTMNNNANRYLCS